MAASSGIGFHVVSSYAGAGVEKEVKRILGIPESLVLVYAIGWATPSPRRLPPAICGFGAR